MRVNEIKIWYLQKCETRLSALLHAAIKPEIASHKFGDIVSNAIIQHIDKSPTRFQETFDLCEVDVIFSNWFLVIFTAWTWA